jgi:hypothetical protein
METITSYNQAEDLYIAAKEELMRPEEDIVPYLICQKCFYAISHYLKGFLHHNNVAFEENDDLKNLIHLATITDGKFNVLNIPLLKRPKETEDVWMNIDSANDFLELAGKTRFMVGL